MIIFMVIFFDKQYKTNYKRFNRYYKKSIIRFHKDYFACAYKVLIY